jgi:hypothetical protein
METQEQQYSKLWSGATRYIPTGNINDFPQAPLSKLNFNQNQVRAAFANPDNCQECSDPVQMVENAAKKGQWILVSTVRFPQFWKRMCESLDQLDHSNQISDSFRLIFDLQGYSQSDISDSFIFDYAIPFHMTEKNTEEFESFEDIWSTILDERVLIKLEEKVDDMKATVLEEQKPKPKKEDEEESKEEEVSSCAAAAMAKDYVSPESPSNFKLIDTTIRSEGQKTLYKQFMNESKARNAGLKFDLMRAQ